MRQIIICSVCNNIMERVSCNRIWWFTHTLWLVVRLDCLVHVIAVVAFFPNPFTYHLMDVVVVAAAAAQIWYNWFIFDEYFFLWIWMRITNDVRGHLPPLHRILNAVLSEFFPFVWTARNATKWMKGWAVSERGRKSQDCQCSYGRSGI